MNGTNKPVAQQRAVPAKAAPAGKKVSTNFLELVVASMANRLHKSKVGLMNETFNPLWNISSRQAQQVYDFARSGNFAQIQRLYDEIERCDPTFLVCTTRRCSAMSVLDWRVVESDERPMRSQLKKMGDAFDPQLIRQVTHKIYGFADAVGARRLNDLALLLNAGAKQGDDKAMEAGVRLVLGYYSECLEG